MASALTWLDFSEQDQRRARELVQLFSQAESLDELGIGVIRDMFSDLMFPGVSTIQTRARYFLFVPWLFQAGAADRAGAGRDLVRWVKDRERGLIELIRKGGDETGLIGRLAGKDVKILPSTIYWNGMQRLGVLAWTGSAEQVAARIGQATHIEDALTEQVERSPQPWHRNLPAPPAGFPNEPLNFGLTLEEANWLRETIAHSCDGTLLAWLLEENLTPQSETLGPWQEPWRTELPGDVARVVDHAAMFSLLTHGAALVYNLLLAERSVDLGLHQDANLVSTYEARLDAWAAELGQTPWRAWSLADLWTLLFPQATIGTHRAQSFVENWFELLLARGLVRIGRDADARTLIGERERLLKGPQARLVNDRMMGQWSGASGAGQLNFRWPQARRLLTDIEDGLAVARS